MRAKIEPLASGNPDTVAAIEEIFFAASGTRSFASDGDKAAFRERWLGRYLGSDARFALVARGDDDRIVGYLVGAIEDPARAPRFGDLAYFAALADLTAQFPAHLHVNLDPAARSLGIGARLVERFSSVVAAEGSKGVHVVTGARARNRRFYERLGFAPLRELSWNNQPIVMLGKRLV